MPSRHVILSSSGLVVAALACTSPGVSFIEATNAAPVTPAVGLPAEWTPAPTTIPGWKKLTGSHTELWLPERYIGGEGSSMIEKLKMHYQGLDQIAEALDSSEHKIRLWAFDPDPGPPAFLTYAMVGVDELKAETSLEANLQDPLTHLTPDKKVHEQGSATLRNDSAFRTVNETRYQNRKVEELANHTTRGDAVWIVINTTDSREYDARLADFELSAQTLIVLP